MALRPYNAIIRLLFLSLLVASCDSTGSETDPIPDRNQIYWTDQDAGKIHRANLDGSDVKDLVSGLDGPRHIVFDVDSSKMYWTEGRFGDPFISKIKRANLNGSDVEELVSGFFGHNGIALDTAGGKMYWTWTGIDAFSGAIQRANLDGSDFETLPLEAYKGRFFQSEGTAGW